MNVPTNLRADQELTPEGKRKVGTANVVQSDPKQDALMDSAEEQLRKLCADRGLDWEAMIETDRLNFVDDLIHEV
ncbi:MAG: hypothetical protein OXU36_06070 [Candidatus Poribacteria bacterium]|nr:hypothetical protein [Candidatus Poribacteria bacterium]